MINNQDLCHLCCIEFELESERLLLALTGSQGKGIFFERQRRITHGFPSRVRKEQSECTEEFWAGQCWASELLRQGMQFTQRNARVIFEFDWRKSFKGFASVEKLCEASPNDCPVSKYLEPA